MPTPRGIHFCKEYKQLAVERTTCLKVLKSWCDQGFRRKQLRTRVCLSISEQNVSQHEGVLECSQNLSPQTLISRWKSSKNKCRSSRMSRLVLNHVHCLLTGGHYAGHILVKHSSLDLNFSSLTHLRQPESCLNRRL